MNTKILLGTPAARGLEHTPLLLDMAQVGKLLVCGDNASRCKNTIRRIVSRLYRDENRRLKSPQALQEVGTVWCIREGLGSEDDAFRAINAEDAGGIAKLLDDLADEYDRRTALASMGGLNDEKALLVIIEDLKWVVKAIDRWETQGLLKCFGPGDTDYPAHGIFLIAGVDIDTLGFLGKRRFQLYNCLDHFSVAMLADDELTADKKRIVCDFFGERVGGLISDGIPTQNGGFLIDFINHPLPFVCPEYKTPGARADK